MKTHSRPQSLVLIALGTNLGDRVDNLSTAYKALSQELGPVVARSRPLETAPVGPADQLFLNAAAIVRTRQSPSMALESLLSIEKEMGRVRRERWGNRIIDLDILLWRNPEGESIVSQSPELVIPHPEMPARDFVLKPAAEIAADWVHPTLKTAISDLLAGLEMRSRKLSAAMPSATNFDPCASPETV